MTLLYCGTHNLLWVLKMLNHGLNHGLFLSLFKLLTCHIHWIDMCKPVSISYLNFRAVLVLPKTAGSAQTQKSMYEFHLNCLEPICISLTYFKNQQWQCHSIMRSRKVLEPQKDHGYKKLYVILFNVINRVFFSSPSAQYFR